MCAALLNVGRDRGAQTTRQPGKWAHIVADQRVQDAEAGIVACLALAAAIAAACGFQVGGCMVEEPCVCNRSLGHHVR